MNTTTRKRFEILLRVRDFGLAHASQFPAGSAGGEAFAALGALVAEVEQVTATQRSTTSSARQQTITRGVARDELLALLRAIRLTARVLAARTPGLADKFRLPKGAGDQALLSTARAFAADAEGHRAEFVRLEMPADFLEDLARKIASFEGTIRERHRSLGVRVSSRATAGEMLRRGRQLVRELDAIVRNKYRADKAVLAEWESARHSAGGRTRAKGDEPGPLLPTDQPIPPAT